VNFQVCVDANLIFAIIFDEPRKAIVQRRMLDWESNGVQLIAPTLFAYEVTSVIRNRVHRGLATPAVGLLWLNEVFSLKVQLHYDLELHMRAWQLAEQLGLPAAYDAHYLALAQMRGCDLWTADQRLYNSAKSQFPAIHFVGE
jgi:predicted nucleic acid-binding protein